MSRTPKLPALQSEVKLGQRITDSVQRFTLLRAATTLRALRTPDSQGARRPRPPPLQTFQTFLLIAPVLLFSVIAHEIAHGWAALRQGDRTALDAGRLSWNPVRHIDFFLTILLPLLTYYGSMAVGGTPMLFGGAKPVPVDPRNYATSAPRRHHRLARRRRDERADRARCALPLIVVAGVLGARGARARADARHRSGDALLSASLLNAVLIAFNLLPIPPLDGSHVFKYLLPRPLAIRYVQFGRYGLLVLILLLQLRRIACSTCG